MASTSFAVGTGGLVTPAASKMTTIGSYLDIRNDGWTKQYLPELYEAEVEKVWRQIYFWIHSNVRC